MAWITVQQAHERLDRAVSVGLIYALARRGWLESTKIGGRVLIDDRSVSEMIGRGRVTVRRMKAEKELEGLRRDYK